MEEVDFEVVELVVTREAVRLGVVEEVGDWHAAEVQAAEVERRIQTAHARRVEGVGLTAPVVERPVAEFHGAGATEVLADANLEAFLPVIVDGVDVED